MPGQQQIVQLEQQFRTNPRDGKVAFELASAYMQMRRTNAAFQILDQLIDSPQADANLLLSVASAYVYLQQGARLETVLEKLVKVSPDNPEAWYDLASANRPTRRSDGSAGSTVNTPSSSPVCFGWASRRVPAGA